MSEAFEQRENEINAALQRWSGSLDVPLPDAVRERTKMATHIAFNEQWLTDAITPSEAAIDRLRSKVHDELTAGGTASAKQTRGWQRTDHSARHMPVQHWSFSPAIGSWAAAAMIAIAFGLIYYSGTTSPVGSADDDTLDDAVIQRFIAVNEPLMSSPALTASISSELDTLEESISTWQPSWSEVDELLDSLEAETGDQSQVGNESADQIASIRTPATEVMG